MRIIRLQTENTKRIRVVDISPNPAKNVIAVGGRNAQGKTSLLDAIEGALAGGKHLQSVPVRTGEVSARTVVDLGDIVVKRTYQAGGTTNLTVTQKIGENPTEIKSPQKMLDELASELTWDPTGFLRATPKAQGAILLDLVPGLSEQIEELEEQHKLAYEKRRDVGRDGLAIKAQKEGLGEGAARPIAEVDVSLLSLELRQANEHNQAIARDEVEVERINSQRQIHRNNIAEWRQLIIEMEGRIAHANALDETLGHDLAKITLRDKIDTAEIEVKLADADKINRMAQTSATYKRLDAEQTKLRSEWEKLENEVKRLENAKLALIRDAQYPVAGLAYSEEGPLYNDLPFAQASGAEQLRVTVAMGAAMHPELKIMLIRDGSLLDDDSMQLLSDLCDEYELQCWLERVGDGDECSLVLEDGEIIRADPAAITVNKHQTKLEVSE
jgi:hypothetical protein